MPYVVKFPTPSYLQTSTDRYTFADRPVFLRPLLEYFDNPRFEWSVDGQVMEGEVERMFKFTPSAPGEYTGPLAPFAAHGGFRRSLRSTRLGTGPARCV